MDTLIYIDNYFTGQSAAATKEEFEKRIAEEPDFAREVAFYLSAKRAAATPAAAGTNERFKEVYARYKEEKGRASVKPLTRRLWPYIAAAAILVAVIIGWVVFIQPASLPGLAERYITENFKTLGVTMGTREDSIQTGLRLYNDGNLAAALSQFESIARNDTTATEAKKYAGIVSLRLQQYDKAIGFFSSLENYTQLYANPGKFYHALTLLKRNEPGDKRDAKKLLEQVVLLDLEGKETAQQWLKQL